jgi:hypothetical protein
MAKQVYIVTCPACGSRDEYTRPDPPEHTCGHLSAVSQLLAIADAIGKSLSRWQQHVLDAFMRSSSSTAAVLGGRIGGRSTAQLLAIGAALARDEHVHVAARDGLWCVQLTSLGAVWLRLRSPRGCDCDEPSCVDYDRQGVTYDEIGDWGDG